MIAKKNGSYGGLRHDRVWYNEYDNLELLDQQISDWDKKIVENLQKEVMELAAQKGAERGIKAVDKKTFNSVMALVEYKVFMEWKKTPDYWNKMKEYMKSGKW
jgi:hypothetical protein